MRIVLHPGPHKTATTMVQSALKAGLKGEVIDGCADARSLDGMVDNFRSIRKSFTALNLHPNAKRVGVARRLLRDYCKAAEDKGITNLVMSEENFLGHPPSFFVRRMGEGQYYRHNAITVQTLAEALEGHEVEVVFTTRKQETLFVSHYMDGIRWLRLDMSLDDFWGVLQQEGVPALRFDSLMTPWRESFGAERVSHLQYEMLQEKAGEFMEAIAARFHLPAGSLTLPERAVNASLPGFKVELARQLYRDVTEGRKDRKSARRQMLSAAPAPGQEAIPRPRLSDESIAQIRAAFADDISYAARVQ